MTKLHISETLSLPKDAITQRISILGRTGSGKSHTAGVLVEEVLKARQQAVIRIQGVVELMGQAP